MKYLYIFGALCVIAGGIALSMYANERPQSVTAVPLMAYSAPEEFMALVLAKVQKPLQESKLVLLGVTPGRKHDLQFWKAFLEETQKSDLAYQAIVIDPKLPHIAEFFPDAVKLDLKNEIARFAEGARNAESQNIRMAVIAPTIYVSQALAQNSVSALKANHGLKPVSLSLTEFPREASEEANMETPCKIGDHDRDATGALGCVIQNRAKLLYRAKRDPAKFEGLVDQLAERDLLIYWNPPRKN